MRKMIDQCLPQPPQISVLLAKKPLPKNYQDYSESSKILLPHQFLSLHLPPSHSVVKSLNQPQSHFSLLPRLPLPLVVKNPRPYRTPR